MQEPEKVLGGKPTSIIAHEILMKLRDIDIQLCACLKTFTKIFGSEKMPENKKGFITEAVSPKPLPFMEIHNSLNKILEDVTYLAQRMDSVL